MAVFLGLTLPVQAHNSSKGLSAISIRLGTTNTTAQLAVSFPDTDKVLKFDKDKDDLVTTNEMNVALGELKVIASKEVEFYFDGHRVTPVEITAVRQESNFEVHFTFESVPMLKVKVSSPLLKRFTSDHQEFVTIKNEKDEQLIEQVLTPADHVYEFTRSNPAVTGATSSSKSSSNSTFSAFLVHGIKHILGGYDHLLFLFALLIMCETFWSVAKIVTCFTIAHTITLALATLDIVNMPSRVVEPMIAATIVYVGIENFFKLKTIQWRWLLTFVFGLIHGFGFAGVLREMDIGTGMKAATKLLAFNLGVEIGQVLIAAIVLPILWELRKIPQFKPRWIPVTSVIVVALGGYWLVTRVMSGP